MDRFVYNFSGMLLTLLAISISAPAVNAQPTASDLDRFRFSADVQRDAAITSPQEFLGYEAGGQFTFHHDMMDYVTTLAEQSDRVQLVQYGSSYEGRPLVYLIVTSEGNHSRLEDIKATNRQLALGDGLGDAEAGGLIDSAPAIVWLSYNVHGNEASSTEAAMQVAYHLASAADDATENLLNDTVVIIDPCLNPDGRDRYVYWYRSMANNILNTRSEELEHDEPWPGGRTNHYWFDLNRDWLWLVHPESQGRIVAYQEWMPQVHVDYHEQGFNSNYFTMPGTTPRNLEIPAEYDDWADIFGSANARAFDTAGISYATREAFDFYYPGYGSSYPTNMGAIGMLTEQGGHSRGGRAVETNDGYILSLRQRVFDHYTTSLATIKTSAEKKKDLLAYFRSFFVPASDDQTVYLFPDDAGSGHLYTMIDILRKHGVEVFKTTESASVSRLNSYGGSGASSVELPAGTFVVPADQPRNVFINTVLKEDLALEDSVTYDMTSWAMPLAYNVTGYWRSGNFNVSIETVHESPVPASSFSLSENPYAFVIDWKQDGAPTALSMLWEKDYRVRSIRKSFTVDGKQYSRGSLIILTGRNGDRKESFVADMELIAERAQVEIGSLDSGIVEEGINPGSDDAVPIKKPTVAVVVDTPVSSYSAGQIWYHFDQDVRFGVSRIRQSDLDNIDLSSYDVLVIPGFGGSDSGITDSSMAVQLKQWVRDGGTLVGLEKGADMLTMDRTGLTSVELRDKLDSEDDSTAASEEEKYLRYADRERNSGLKRIPGAAFQGIIDDSNPLAFGMPDMVYSLKQTDSAFEPADDYQVVGYYAKQPDDVLVAGYVSDEQKERLAGGVFAAVQPSGRGRVVLLADNTQYRYFWIGPSRLLTNAVMILGGM